MKKIGATYLLTPAFYLLILRARSARAPSGVRSASA
jgi:hypothetical protein